VCVIIKLRYTAWLGVVGPMLTISDISNVGSAGQIPVMVQSICPLFVKSV